MIFIVGPTAVGKTSLAIRLAEKTNGEIISADSMQVYKGMDILSQRTTKKEEKRICHHLVGFLDPSEEYSAAQFSRRATMIIDEIIQRHKTPIITGGSGLYIKALIDGLFPSRDKDVLLRERLHAIAEEKGNMFLYERLSQSDPDAARRIHPNDLKRVIRALEISELEKETKTALRNRTKGIKDKYDIRVFGLIMDRKKLYAKIGKRVDKMFDAGIVREVKALLGRKTGMTAKCALGIKQIEGYIAGIYDIEKAKDLLKKDTRRFAKRQLTWFRADKSIVWIDMDETGENGAIKFIENALKK